jgi:hypothetical protein
MTNKSDKENPTEQPTAAVVNCSFCGKSQEHVRKIIAGPGVHICDECIDLCSEILERDAEPASVPLTSRVVAIGSCRLCSLPKDVAELRIVADRGPLCVECIDAVRSVEMPEGIGEPTT